MKQNERSVEVAKVLEKAVVKSFAVESSSIVIELLDEAAEQCMSIVSDRWSKTEIEKRVAEWKLRIFCDKNKDIKKVNQLFTDCLNLGFTTLENKTEMFIYFLNYCDRKKEFLTLKKYLDIIKSEFAVVGQEDNDYHKSLLSSLNSLTCSR